MNLGFSTLGCPDWTLEQAVAAAKQQGYDGLELRLIDGQVITPELVAANAERIERLFGEAGLGVAALGSSARFSAADRAERGQSEAAVAALVPLAKRLHAPVIRVFGGRRAEGVTMPQAIEYVADSLNRLAPVAEAAGVALALETHDDFSRAADVAATLRLVPSPAIGALWDTHHPYRMGESAAEVWEAIGGRLVHTHIKDARRAGDGWDLVLLGEGEVPVREAVRTLVGRDYGGYLVVEWEKKWHPEIPEPEVAFPQHIRLLREYLAGR